MTFIRWNSIRTLGHDEFINEPADQVIAMEKLDGMNVSVTSEYVAGRNGPIPKENFGYRGWVKEGLRLKETSLAEKYILFGEWLVSHTAEYKPEALNKFYLFSAVDKKSGKEVPFGKVSEIASELKVETPEVFFKGTFAELELNFDILVGKSNLSYKENTGEGIVILNITKNFRTKLVTSHFKERSKISFKLEKLSREEDSERWAEEYATQARITKILHKMLDEEIILEKDLLFSNFNFITNILLELTFEDMLEESETTPEFFVKEKAFAKTRRNVILTVKKFLK